MTFKELHQKILNECSVGIDNGLSIQEIIGALEAVKVQTTLIMKKQLLDAWNAALNKKETQCEPPPKS